MAKQFQPQPEKAVARRLRVQGEGFRSSNVQIRIQRILFGGVVTALQGFTPFTYKKSIFRLLVWPFTAVVRGKSGNLRVNGQTSNLKIDFL